MQAQPLTQMHHFTDAISTAKVYVTSHALSLRLQNWILAHNSGAASPSSQASKLLYLDSRFLINPAQMFAPVLELKTYVNVLPCVSLLLDEVNTSAIQRGMT